ncbi:hypothetical protein GGC47_003139 [Bosea sp. OAE752]|jgi:hypothetical protein|uniref:hypothetical protein n=1 Tax=Bosea sp. OAE752 TaxID=2663873 RepID=UPI003D243B07
MRARDDTTPISDRFSLEDVIGGLATDLTDLRAGKISVPDAMARAELAKQIMNGVRLVVNVRKVLEKNAKQIGQGNGDA